MKVTDNDSVDPAVYELLEFIRNSRREKPLPAFKAQFLSGYNLPDEEEPNMLAKPPDSSKRDESTLRFE